MEDKFCHLHVHSTYSFTDGYGTPDQYINRAKELGQTSLGVTDHGNVSAHFKWYKKCNASGIKPILGCEMYIVKDNDDIREREYNHITVLAKNNIGYRNLMKLVTKSYNQFYYKPRITYQDLFDHQEGLIVLSGCLSSPVMELLKENRMDDARNMLKLFISKIKHFYIELQPITFEAGKLAYERLIDLYHELRHYGMKWVATSDCHYVIEEQAKVQELLLCVQSHAKMSDPDHWHFDQDDFFLKSRQQMFDSLVAAFPYYDRTEIEKSLDNTIEIADMVDFEFPTATPIKFPMKEEDKIQFIKDECEKGLIRISKKDDKVYRERVEYELDLIQKKEFVDYFLVIHDLVNWAKSAGILVGPARGSAAGSLACYLLRITEVDPIPYELLFERFIDINREDLPDIDVDFEDSRRHEVKEYLISKYGADKVGNLPTFAEFKGKSALHDVGSAFEVPDKLIYEVKGLVIERSGGDSRANFTLADTFMNDEFPRAKEILSQYPELKYSIGLEGQYRQMGQHAAGIVISNEPLTDFCAIYKINGESVISLAYDDATAIGLLKIDLLGLSTLSVISKALSIVEKKTGKKIDMYTLPLDDSKVYEGFLSQKMFGIFQFDGQAVNQVSRQIGPKEFGSLSAISALARPGPLNGGVTTSYILRRQGKEKVSYAHEVMKSYTKDTYGLVVYQEQVMKTMREVGKMSWKDTSEIRKLISRNQGVERFNTFKDKFSIGAKENGMTEKEIDNIWESICTFGSWAFNKSHSVSYTIISYWTMWLKIYSPMEFYSSILSLTSNESKKKSIVKEYKREGYKVLPVDINRSKESFSIDGDAIRIGFCDILKIGPSYGKMISDKQPYSSYREYISKHEKKRVPESVTQKLVNLGAFDSMAESSFETNLFGEVVNDFNKKEMTMTERVMICPWDVDFGIERDWLPTILKFPESFPMPPTNISIFKQDEDENEEMKDVRDNSSMYEDITIMGVVYDKNLKDYREEAGKGKNVDLTNKKGLYKYANFVLEDDTDFITIRLSNFAFVEPTCQNIPYTITEFDGAKKEGILNYGQLIFQELRPDDVIIVRGILGKGIRMFFADRIVSLRHFKEYYERTGKPQQFTPKKLRYRR